MHPGLRKLPLLLGRGVAAVSALALLVSGSVAATWFIADQRKADQTSASRKPNEAEKAAITQSFLGLPLSFEANKGQTDRVVDFISRGAGQTLFLTKSEAVFSLSKREAPARRGQPAPEPVTSVVRMRILGANPEAKPAAHERLPGKVNYLLGRNPKLWRTNIPTFAQVGYAGVYPGIDLAYHGTQGRLEYDFVVAPGADPSRIALGIVGAESLSIDERGDLVIGTPAGDVRQARPTIYQENGGRQPVEGRFVLRNDREVGFEVGAYDHTRPLVIDPVLQYSTFLGGTANDFGWGIDVDNDGNVYLAGLTGSTTFPTTGGAYDTIHNGSSDGYALKMNSAGNALVWATYIGGTAADAVWDLARDTSGNVYLAGTTQSTNFPTNGSVAAYDTTCGSDALCNAPPAPALVPADNFVAKLGPNGDTLLYSTYLGGSEEEQVPDQVPYDAFMGLAVYQGKAYLTSMTFSSDYPTTANAFQKTCGSCSNALSDAFISVIDTTVAGQAGLVFSSFHGGRATDEGKNVAVDSTGKAYVTGHTIGNAENAQGDPTLNNFRVKNAFQATYRGGYSDAYVAKYDPFASKPSKSLVWSTFLGGGGLEEGWDITLAPGGTEPYIVGYTTSGPNPNPHDNNASVAGPGDDPGHPDACLQAPDPNGLRPYCDFAPDPAPYFPTNTGPAYAGRASTASGSALFLDGDAFVTKMNSAGTGIVWSRFLGGPNADYGQGIDLDSDGKVYVTGWTTCRNQDVISTVGYDPPAQFYTGVPDITDGTPTGLNPGEPAQTNVADCPNGFPQVSPVNQSSPPGPDGVSPINETVMDTTLFGPDLHNSPTGVFAARLSANGVSVEYAVLLDGNGFDRGFAIAVRDRDSANSPITPEAYVTGRVGSCGAPRPCINGLPYPTTSGAFDTTYNGAGRDTFISKLVG